MICNKVENCPHKIHRIHLSQVAIEFNYAEEHLSRTIKKYFGMNFSDILRETKLNKAIALINQTNLSINNIALAVRYTDYTNFYRAFKGKFDISPSEYRKMNQL
ncbi:MAG: helix-turn-helix domain-containing protein [Eubacteriaceae bacterium]